MVRIAQIGCGHWGRNLTRNFAELGVLAAVVDGHPDTAAAMSAQYGVPATDFDSVLADPTIDAIALATPAETHARLADRAIAAGKHVYVEKPLALDPRDARRVINAAEAANVRLMVGHLLHYHPIFLEAQRMASSGELGKLRYVYSNRMSLGKFRVEENVLWSFAPHDISMLLGIVGEAPSIVTAQGAAFVTPGIADWCTLQLRFPSGVAGHVTTSWLHPFKEQRLVIIGEKGMLVFEDSVPEWDKKLALYRHDIDTSGPAPVPQAAQAEYIAVPKGEPLKDECRHFVESIENGTTPRTDGNEGLRVLEVLSRAEAELANSIGRLTHD